VIVDILLVCWIEICEVSIWELVEASYGLLLLSVDICPNNEDSMEGCIVSKAVFGGVDST